MTRGDTPEVTSKFRAPFAVEVYGPLREMLTSLLGPLSVMTTEKPVDGCRPQMRTFVSGAVGMKEKSHCVAAGSSAVAKSVILSSVVS